MSRYKKHSSIHEIYSRKRAELINEGVKQAREYMKHMSFESDTERGWMFNRVFLHMMDKLAYKNNLTHIPPNPMSHECGRNSCINNDRMAA